jgi:hypothetical protein
MKNIIHESVRPWALASLCYDEYNFIDYISQIVPNAKFEMSIDKNGAHYYGWIGDKTTDTLHFVYRGTDGIDEFGNFKSWLTNANIFTSGDGVHNGFQKIGDSCFDKAKPHIYNYHIHRHYGHSQGGAEAQYGAVLSAENVSNLTLSQFIVFASPPAGNHLFGDRVNNLIRQNKLMGFRYVFPNDPITTKVLRNPSSSLLNGVDVGIECLLPNTLRYTDRPLFNLLAHSPQQYTAGMIARELMRDEPNIEILKSLEWVRERLAN